VLSLSLNLISYSDWAFKGILTAVNRQKTSIVKKVREFISSIFEVDISKLKNIFASRQVEKEETGFGRIYLF
jgi:hypothetical protein